MVQVLPRSQNGNKCRSMQREAYCLFARLETSSNFSNDLMSKMEITFGGTLSSVFRIAPNWFEVLRGILPLVKPQVCMSLLKTFVGGWTTTHRMHEPNKLSCLFGCRHEKDEMLHYIRCTPLWLIVAEAFGCSSALCIEERLCLRDATPRSMNTHSVVFQTYHFVKASLSSEANGGLVQPTPHYAQCTASECAKAYAHRYQ